MRAAVMYGAGDVRVENRPDPKIVHPADAVVRTVAACVCGSDLWPYGAMPATDTGRPMGHEFLGVVEETGADVTGLKAGDLVVAPFTYSDNTCDYCAKGLHISCRNGGRYGFDGVDGGQGDAVRVPHCDGTLVKLPVAADSELVPSLLVLSDVMTTGHHGAVTAGVGHGDTVLVVGDGAVGLCAVIAAKRLGAERILLAGRHAPRTDLGRDFGATDVVAERGDEGIAHIRDLTGGVDKVIEAVGTRQALDTALGAVLDGGTISRLGVPQYEQGPIGPAEFMRNVTLTGGASPARAYIEQLLPDVLDGSITPGRVFDRTFALDQTPDAYRSMADRQVLKALITP
ncbi:MULTISPECIES: alcohol dehydrogenase catalytic domain-containing protein [unclassified Streptomyces]|jgi:threonine dehydrogenase-like Zn-dependent dehydrogenase|uniref:zinc-binding dehydrogenase n=2 Tax=Streptomyces TaxID=1883 RepID=UPI0022500F17|nr:alcohol dehydrogenase catalytic domain-containing protein [Streptomyces sp. NBC_01446]MCX4648557.1 alcohol dehydrogenase catalytic domain-containing protein [Streptomyces sp. NBC_01446]